MQRLCARVCAGVAEEDRIAALGRDLQADVGKHRATAALGLAEVHHHRGHALAAPAKNGRRTGLLRVEVIVVRLVLGARAVLQDLKAFSSNLVKD